MMTAQTPRWVWGLLVAAVVGVSSAGALFQHVDAVPPLLRASWRLQLTSIVLFPFFYRQWSSMDEATSAGYRERRTWALLFASGVALAAHFGTWVASLDMTTLTHSLLFVTAHPLVIVVGMLMLAPFVAAVRAPLHLESVGALICFAGAGITLLDAGSAQGDQTVTVVGDALAFSGAVFVVGYIVVGRILRTWMPIFLYAFPVTFIASVLLLPASMLMEEDFGTFGSFGWTDPAYFGWFLLLACVAGFLGHTGLNTCLRYISPLVVSVAVTLEPVLGSLIGWLFFGAGVPGQWTWVGGAVLLAGLMTVVVAAEQTSLAEANNESTPV
jgi:drug/metabolite transporter (DMT)-like permease